MRVAAAVALAILLAACTPTVPVSPPASQIGGSSPPTPAPTIPPVPTSELVGWHKVATTDAMGNGPAAIAWFKDRWVAIGADRSGKQWHPLAWWSADGVTWASGSLGKVPGGGVSSLLVGLAIQGDTLVAFGWSSSELDTGSTVDLARAAAGPASGDVARRPVVAAVARGSAGAALAVQCFPSVRSANALVMTSTDGATWTTVPDSSALHGQPMLGVAALRGSLVAVGGADGTKRSAVWTSTDGQQWTRAPDSATLRDGVMQGVIAVGDALVAWGFYLDEEICPAPMLWRSTDGVAWSEVSDPIGLRSLWRSVSTAATAGVGLTAIGTTGGRAVDLTTSDGYAWTAHDLPEDLDYGPIIAVPGGFLAGGRRRCGPAGTVPAGRSSRDHACSSDCSRPRLPPRSRSARRRTTAVTRSAPGRTSGSVLRSAASPDQRPARLDAAGLAGPLRWFAPPGVGRLALESERKRRYHAAIEANSIPVNGPVSSDRISSVVVWSPVSGVPSLFDSVATKMTSRTPWMMPITRPRK